MILRKHLELKHDNEAEYKSYLWKLKTFLHLFRSEILLAISWSSVCGMMCSASRSPIVLWVMRRDMGAGAAQGAAPHQAPEPLLPAPTATPQLNFHESLLQSVFFCSLCKQCKCLMQTESSLKLTTGMCLLCKVWLQAWWRSREGFSSCRTAAPPAWADQKQDGVWVVRAAWEVCRSRERKPRLSRCL